MQASTDISNAHTGVIWRKYSPDKLPVLIFSYVIDTWHRELLCPHHTDLRYGLGTFERVFLHHHIKSSNRWGVSTPPTYLTHCVGRSSRTHTTLCSLCHPVHLPVSQYDDIAL